MGVILFLRMTVEHMILQKQDYKKQNSVSKKHAKYQRFNKAPFSHQESTENNLKIINCH